MKFLVASVALFGIAAAAPAARSAPQPMAMPCPTTTATATATETESPSAECQVTPGAVTDVLPAGLKGVMVSNVAYYAAPALYGCADKAKFMKIWAAQDCDDSFKFWYCCGSECDRIPSVPKNTTCEVQGKEYTVGFTYENVELKNKNGNKEKVTLWCTTEDDHVTCKGDKCGSSLELTPPGIEVCEKPAPPAPKPSDYTTCESCVRAGFNYQDGKCVNYCISSGGICNPCMQPPQPPKYRDCESCTRHGFSWQGTQCLNKCLLGSPYECVQRPDQCPRTPDCNDFKTCTDCTANGFSWQGDKCLNRCLVGSPFPCVQTPAQCPVETDCTRCIKAGNTFDLNDGQCHDGLICPRTADAKCTRDIADCPVPY